jgi:hypothetical protein
MAVSSRGGGEREKMAQKLNVWFDSKADYRDFPSGSVFQFHHSLICDSFLLGNNNKKSHYIIFFTDT